jgi:hypothetical protein
MGLLQQPMFQALFARQVIAPPLLMSGAQNLPLPHEVPHEELALIEELALHRLLDEPPVRVDVLGLGHPATEQKSSFQLPAEQNVLHLLVDPPPLDTG